MASRKAVKPLLPPPVRFELLLSLLLTAPMTDAELADCAPLGPCTLSAPGVLAVCWRYHHLLLKPMPCMLMAIPFNDPRRRSLSKCGVRLLEARPKRPLASLTVAVTAWS